VLLDSCVEAALLVCCSVSMTQAAKAAAHLPAPTASLLRRLGVRIRYCDLNAFIYGCISSGICWLATTNLPTNEGPWLDELVLHTLRWRSVRFQTECCRSEPHETIAGFAMHSANEQQHATQRCDIAAIPSSPLE
jgi:hypothetical protein